MTLVHGLYESTGHDPLLIRLPLHPRRRSSKAVAIAVTGAAAATAVRVTASIGEVARQAGVRDASFPVTLGAEETSVTLSPVAATGDLAFQTASGVSGVLTVDGDEPDTESFTGVDDVAIVAALAILVIGGMVVAAIGGSFSGKAGDVEVTTEPADGGSPPAPRLIGGRR
jgi:hypothetical protein